jgi:hypothetical protein
MTCRIQFSCPHSIFLSAFKCEDPYGLSEISGGIKDSAATQSFVPRQSMVSRLPLVPLERVALASRPFSSLSDTTCPGPWSSVEGGFSPLNSGNEIRIAGTYEYQENHQAKGASLGETTIQCGQVDFNAGKQPDIGNVNQASSEMTIKEQSS